MLACSLDSILSEVILSGLTRFGYGESFFLPKGTPQQKHRRVLGAWTCDFLLEHREEIFSNDDCKEKKTQQFQFNNKKKRNDFIS